ncbi:hypothetical protein STEG23_021443 [Scotinomys teguina]
MISHPWLLRRKEEISLLLLLLLPLLLLLLPLLLLLLLLLLPLSENEVNGCYSLGTVEDQWSHKEDRVSGNRWCWKLTPKASCCQGFGLHMQQQLCRHRTGHIRNTGVLNESEYSLRPRLRNLYTVTSSGVILMFNTSGNRGPALAQGPFEIVALICTSLISFTLRDEHEATDCARRCFGHRGTQR